MVRRWLIVACSIVACNAIAGDKKPSLSSFKLSTEEFKLLKRIDQIQSGAGLASTMLKLSPFITLAASPAPSDVAITIGSNDWDKIYGALTGLKKIETCQTSKEIQLFEIDGDYSSSASKEFFTDLKSKSDEVCQ